MADTSSTCPDISIVIATYARADCLKRCIERTIAATAARHEIIVVGGGMDAASEAWIARQPGVRFIPEPRREGATRAYNRGFRASTGEFVLWLNDDSYPLPGAIDAALRLIQRPDLADVGMVACYHNHIRDRNRLDSIERDGVAYAIYNVRGDTYANFGLLRRALLERLGYLDEGYYFCAWDPDLSLKVQREAGLRVVGCRDALIRHDEIADDRKRSDLDRAEQDNARLFAKWGLPEKFAYPDPAPAYRAMCVELAIG